MAFSDLALPANVLISLTDSEIEKILEWLNGRGLHFGQSAYIALEHLMAQGGVTYETLLADGLDFTRETLAVRLILIDILTGIITPFEEDELLISLYKVAPIV